MRRRALVLVLFLALFGFATAGCGGEEEATPTPETVEGTVGTTETTETTETETTETETTTGETETETTETETGGGGAGPGDAAAGKEIFLGTAGCGSCHTLSDAGTSGTVGPNLDDAKPSADLVVERVTNGMGAMPPFKGTLTEQQINDVAAYVSSVAGS
jgi:mono/diheme cytochrome c family protein